MRCLILEIKISSLINQNIKPKKANKKPKTNNQTEVKHCTWVFCPVNLINALFPFRCHYSGTEKYWLIWNRRALRTRNALGEEWLVAALLVPARSVCCRVNLWHSISLCEYVWIWVTELPSGLGVGTGKNLVSTIFSCQASQSGAEVPLLVY